MVFCALSTLYIGRRNIALSGCHILWKRSMPAVRTKTTALTGTNEAESHPTLPNVFRASSSTVAGLSHAQKELLQNRIELPKPYRTILITGLELRFFNQLQGSQCLYCPRGTFQSQSWWKGRSRPPKMRYSASCSRFQGHHSIARAFVCHISAGGPGGSCRIQ